MANTYPLTSTVPVAASTSEIEIRLPFAVLNTSAVSSAVVTAERSPPSLSKKVIESSPNDAAITSRSLSLFRSSTAQSSYTIASLTDAGWARAAP